LLNFLKPYKWRFGAAILFGFLNGLTTYALMKGVPIIWDIVFQGQKQDSSSPMGAMPSILKSADGFVETLLTSFVKLWTTVFTGSSSVVATIALVPAIMLLRSVSNYLHGYLLSWVGSRIITDIRHKVFTHLQTLSLDYFNRANVGDLMSRLVNDCQQVQSSITTVISDSLKHPFTIVILAYGLIQEDWKFSLAAVTLAPLCILPIAIYGRKVRRTSKLSQENQGEIVSRLHENITGVRVVKAFHMEAYEEEKFWKTCYRQFSYQMKIVRSVNILSPMIEVVAAIGVSFALFYAYQNQIPSGKFWGLLIGIFFLYDPIKNLSKLHTTIQKSLASTDRVLAVLDSTSSVVESPTAQTLAPVRQHIEFKNVSFRYEATLKWVLHDVSLKIPHGKTVAIVGRSGSGKSTLLNLLPRFYDPVEGSVAFDGVDLKNVTLSSLRQQMAIVTQDTILFNDTIRNNIRYGSLHASDEQIIAAARRAHAHDFITQQAEGYDTIVGDKGIKISGGQKQRIAIARAILKDPAILLLDEATSALDTESERLVQEALDELVRGRTVVSIAHRLSTIQRADLIVVLEHGKIVEQGTHQELLNSGKVYRKLHDLQFQEV
jgi:ATP-binding cassette, subfamily B, bacterial MsbA